MTTDDRDAPKESVMVVLINGMTPASHYGSY